jgi:hypothetical protein
MDGVRPASDRYELLGMNYVREITLALAIDPGRGVQLEAILAYSLNKSFSVGAGGRYWAMWATDSYTNIFGTPCPCQTLPARTERYGAFAEASYKLDGWKGF